MGRADFLKLGDWNFICFRCGRKAKSSTARRQWQGYSVCDRPGCYEPRQSQDFVRGIPDIQSPPWVQPPAADIFVKFCTPNGRTAYPGFAEPGCVLPSFIDHSFNPAIK